MHPLLQKYQSLLQSRPVVTSSITSGLLFAIGDVISQFAVERKSVSSYEPERTARAAFFGGCIAGPAMTVWYRVLSRLTGSIKPEVVKVAAMVTLDQTIYSPVFISIYYTSINLLKGDSFEQSSTKLKETLWPTLLNNWRIWPLVNFVNFFFFPLHMRVIVANTVGVFWNTYLAFMANKENLHNQQN